eukprot:2539104-Prymnesium_polylepis.1
MYTGDGLSLRAKGGHPGMRRNSTPHTPRRSRPPSLASGAFIKHVDVLTQVDLSPTCERHP